MKKPLLLFRVIEAFPLPVFLLYAAMIDQSLPQNWLGPFVASSSIAILTTTILLFNKVPLNRLVIGITLYLIIGSLALWTNHTWLNQMYGKLEASGMLASIIIVGMVSLLVSPAGFIGVVSPDRKKVVMFSLSLLLVALIAFILSFSLQGNKLFSEIIPFIGLFSIQGLLRSQMTKAFFCHSRTRGIKKLPAP
jgi:hypothetical protein